MAMSVMFSSMLFEPFAGAEIENRGGEEHNRCDSINGVVHGKNSSARVLRKWSAADKEVVSGQERSNDVTKQPNSPAISRSYSFRIRSLRDICVYPLRRRAYLMLICEVGVGVH